MDINKSVERVEKRIAYLEDKMNLFEGESYTYERYQTTQEIEALETVLTSAKLLHNLLDRETFKVGSYETDEGIQIDSEGYASDIFIELSGQAYKAIGL